jgi:hypothetical protein
MTRKSLRAKLAARGGSQPYAPRRAPRADAAEAPDSFIHSKKDKRLVKHSSFVSRIEKANKKPLKRRRPGRKLVTDLDSLRKALPELLVDGETEEGLQQLKERKLRMKSLRSRKGALKRKEKVVKGEVQRFQASLARLNAVSGLDRSDSAKLEMQQAQEETVPEASMAAAPENGNTNVPQNPTANRWAALRGFISATMEQSPAFVNKAEGRT